MVRRTVTTLKNRCFEVLAENINTLLVDLEDQNKCDLKKVIQRKWSHDLFERMKDPLQKNHASFFINGYLKELAFHRFSSDEIEEIMQILRAQGEGILLLSLMGSRCPRYKEATILRLAESLPSTLTCLQFWMVECSENILGIVGDNCPNLQQLHLTDCTGVTDAGMEALFVNADESQNTSLQFLDLRGTSVTQRGIIVVLEFCPNITKLLNEHLNYAILYAYHCLLSLPIPFKTFNLKTFVIHTGFLASARFLRAWRVMCPRVENLSISYMATRDELKLCSGFKNLKNASFHSSEALSLSSFLEARGSELQSLSSCGREIVSIASVMKFCPNLVFLSLSNPHLGSSDAVEDTTYSMAQLRTLEIMNMNIDTAKREMRSLFLSSPNIETIKFRHVSGFTDDFASLVAMHDTVHLRNFGLMYCDIDVSTLNMVIMGSPDLTCLSISRCQFISRQQGMCLEQLRDGLSVLYESEFSF